MVKRLSSTLLTAFIVLSFMSSAWAQERFITVASTTSTEQSGLFGHLLPRFTQATGITVRVVALGTGQALRLGVRGDVDVVFVHDQPSEERFVAEGYGLARHDVMHNDFILVGPAGDPAGVRGARDILTAFTAVAAIQAPFVSRGDDSGTHKTERRLWAETGLSPAPPWYRETGSGMGPTLNTAAAMDAYALADRGTWLGFRNRRSLEIVFEGDERLFNPYGVILVNPERHPHVKAAEGQAFIDWLVSDKGQSAITEYTINGEQLFFPHSTPTH